METRSRTPVNIFECYVEYIRPQNREGLHIEPWMKTIFPKNYQFDADNAKKNLTSFLFPLKDCNTGSEEHFTFTLTNLKGQFRYGFCRYPAKGDVCMCFLSDLPWFKVFYKIMDTLSDMHLAFQSEMVQPFLKALHNHPIPNLATDSILTLKLDDLDGQVFKFSLPNPKILPEIATDYNLNLFYPLHYEVFLCLFANLVFERRIIITSNSLTKLSASVHGIASLLYPLFWQHIFIPLTPPHLTDYCTAPMPFLMGVHSSIMRQVRNMPINDAVILDVDQNELETPYTDDLLKMPAHIMSQLRHVLKKESSAYGDTVTKALLNSMVAMFGGYRTALKIREGESKVSFDEESFIRSQPHMEKFLSEVVHFQHFQQFIKNRMDKLNERRERDIFDEAIILFNEDERSSKFSSGQIKMEFRKIKRMVTKHTQKALKSTGSLMKDTHKLLQEKIAVGPVDYPDLSSSWFERGFKPHNVKERTFSVPRTSKDTMQYPSSIFLACKTQLSCTSLPFKSARLAQLPPPVVPYDLHIKRKLSKSDYLRDDRLSMGDGVPFFLRQQEDIDGEEIFPFDMDEAIEMRTRRSVIIRPMPDEESDSASTISSDSSGSTLNDLSSVFTVPITMQEEVPLPSSVLASLPQMEYNRRTEKVDSTDSPVNPIKSKSMGINEDSQLDKSNYVSLIPIASHSSQLCTSTNKLVDLNNTNLKTHPRKSPPPKPLPYSGRGPKAFIDQISV